MGCDPRLEEQWLFASPETQQKADAGHTEPQSGAAGAEEGKPQTDHGQEVEHHSEVHDRVEGK
jgi:hypothetical protein